MPLLATELGSKKLRRVLIVIDILITGSLVPIWDAVDIAVQTGLEEAGWIKTSHSFRILMVELIANRMETICSDLYYLFC